MIIITQESAQRDTFGCKTRWEQWTFSRIFGTSENSRTHLDKEFRAPKLCRVHSLYKYFFVQLYIIKLTLLCRSFDRDQTLLSLVWWPVFFPLMIILGICTSDVTSLRRNWSPTVSRPHAASWSVNPSFAKSFSALPSIFCSMREIKRKH